MRRCCAIPLGISVAHLRILLAKAGPAILYDLEVLVSKIFGHLVADVRYALRGLRKAPLFTAVAVLSMALGIGANTAIFTLVDQVLLRRLPVDRAEKLVQVSAPGSESYGGGMGDGTELSYAMYRDLRDHNSAFSGMFCRMPWSMQASYGGRTEQVTGEMVSGTFFPLLGVRPAAGRLFSADDERSIGGHPVAVLSHGYWRSRFGSDPKVVGTTIVVNRHALEIVGVVQAGFEGLDLAAPVQVYVPIVMQPQMGPAWLRLEDRRFRFVQAFGQLRDGVSADQALAGLQPLYRSLLEQESQETAFSAASADTKRRFLEGRLTVDDASRGHSNLRTQVTEPLLILMAVACGVLLIVCANVANLLIARGAARQREVALRLAVGGSRWQIVQLLLAESLVLAFAGGGLGLLVASWGADALLGFFAMPDGALAVTSGPDGRILLFTCALATGTAFLAGVVPAIRSSHVDLAPTLKGSGGAIVGEQPRLRKTLVAVQVALSFLLLVGAGLFVRSLTNLLDVDPGFRTARMVSFSFHLEASGYDAERARAFAKTFQDRLSRTPGVSSVAYAFQSLLGGGGWGMGFTVEGYKPPPGESAGSMANAVSPGFFNTMGMRIIAGREFDERDERGFAKGWPYTVAVVNETFAKRYFGAASPIGRHIGIGDDPGTETRIEIVGLVRNAKYTGIREDERAQVFFPYLQATMEGVTAYVRTTQDEQAVMGTIRREMAALDSNLAIFGVSTLDDLVDRSVVNERLIASLSATLGVMATLLSVIGLYGVMASVVARRTREIGIRMALGAVGADIALGVLREAGLLVAVGLGVGFGASWWLGRYVQGQLYGITPADAPTIALAALILTTVAAIAAILPAGRAARVAPMTAIRGE
jgi:predicted permease